MFNPVKSYVDYVVSVSACPGREVTSYDYVSAFINLIVWLVFIVLLSSIVHGIVLCFNSKKDRDIIKLGRKKITSSIIGIIILFVVVYIINIIRLYFGPIRQCGF